MTKDVKVDMHLHTCFSDGDTELETLLKSLKAQKIEVFSFTDHETIAPVGDIRALSSKYGLTFIVGVELTVNHNGKKHILGYGIDPDNEALKEVMAHNQFLVKNNLDHATRFLSAETAIQAILLAGGIPIIAHPNCAVYQHDYKLYIEELLALGAMGIECFHPENSSEVTAYCLSLCKQHGLLITGGSDYHGASHPSRTLGVMNITLKDLMLKPLGAIKEV